MRFFKLTFMIIIGVIVASFAIATPPRAQQAAVLNETILKGAALSSPVTVLELFTSQGCSSCPAANKFVREIAAKGDVLALSYSVDYWDYLGWKDTFGKPEFSAHQRTYGQQFGGQVYTPQMVINGAVHNSRFSDKKVRALQLKNMPEIVIKAAGDGLDVHIVAKPTSGKHLSIMAVRYRPGVQSVPVKRGENRGRTIELVNVVQACAQIGKIKHTGSFNTQLLALAHGEALVILVQDGKGGPILGAANYTP